MNHQQFKEAWQDDRMVSVDKDIDNSWRHGCYVAEVFKDEDTGKFWLAEYRVSGDHETHGIRDGDFALSEVEPVTETITVTRYVNKDES